MWRARCMMVMVKKIVIFALNRKEINSCTKAMVLRINGKVVVIFLSFGKECNIFTLIFIFASKKGISQTFPLLVYWYFFLSCF